MIRYEIWAEGFSFSDGSGVASKLGEADGEDFRNAVENWFKDHPSSLYDSRGPSYLGMQLFPSEIEARKNFG